MERDEANIGVAEMSELVSNEDLSLGVSKKSVDFFAGLMGVFGQVLAPTVARIGEGDRYVILNNHCIYDAMKITGKEKISVLKVNLKDENDKELLSLILTRLKEETCAITQGMLIERLVKERKYTLGELSKMLGVSKAWLSKRHTLVRNLEGEVKDLVSGHTLHSRTAEEVAKLPLGAQFEFAQKIIREVLSKDKVAKLVALHNDPGTSSGLREAILDNPAGVPLGKLTKHHKAKRRPEEAGRVAKDVRFALTASLNATKGLMESCSKGYPLPESWLLKDLGEAAKKLAAVVELALRSIAAREAEPGPSEGFGSPGELPRGNVVAG